ncbi:hypothetical protein KIN20_014310 [Parelaphostrongylus tenuis]|uniref:Uncharacterized protein n=1 Tax=Parelaphostrongylus tenuis TaxID=148309 RepID=A0AAD5N337_PARTN|nr:hypothetical protein KIN20_014310 [Parelaphostrongylus tenuis]
MQTVFEVLERQARSALLPDAVISDILGQLEVKTTYEPLNCQKVFPNPDRAAVVMAMETACYIVSNTVTALCIKENMMCMPNMMDHVKPIPSQHLSIPGTLTV